MNIRSRWLVVAVLVIAASLAVVNATVFGFRQLSGTASVVQSTGLDQTGASELGAGCTGFYILGAPSGDTIANSSVLPNGGTNHDNAINTGSAWLGVKTSFGTESCSWSDGVGTNTLYDSATIYLNVTQGTWYAKDVLAFGYPAIITSLQPNPIYVTLKVESPINTTAYSNITSAYMYVYKTNSTSTTLVGTIDLTSSNAILTGIQLAPGEALQLDLKISSTGTVSNAPFTVGFYVSTSNEAPR